MENALTWFEIPVKDIQRAKAFYEEVFKFELRDMVMEHVKLAIFPATEVSGALIEEPDYLAPERGVVLYLNIPDTIESVLLRTEQNGGKVVTTKTLIQEDVGWSAAFRDLDGNLIGLYQSV
ncbi:MAG: VOC family protein [Candidatus Marinimicrobia bacterium]|nr:VOC family protein [Candidatus Neomarinimicrobiota bacterium]